MALDLSCITRFHVCRAVEELSPSAAQLLREDRARLSANMKWKLPCDTQTARILGRDSDFVNVAKVKSIQPDEEDRYVDADYDTIKVLKGESLQMKKFYHPREFADAATINSERLLRVGGERLVFLSKMLDKPISWSDCAVMPDTPENLAAVLEGIAADRSATIGQE